MKAPNATADETPDTCSYCATPFEDDGIFWLTQPNDLTEANPMRIAFCRACTGVHRQGTCGRCNTEAYHPTLDNTPWGEPGCRVCETPDPFTHLLGFLGHAIQSVAMAPLTLKALQAENLRLQERNADLHRINSAVHAQMARMHNPVTHARLATAFVATLATTLRFHGDIHIGTLAYHSITDAVRAGYLAGVADTLALKDQA